MDQTVNLKKPAEQADVGSATVNLRADDADTVEGDVPSSPNAAAADWSGKTLGEYEIGELLGVGGNGQVFKARHRCLDMPVALKILHGVEPDDEDSVNRFRREAMASARLMHPNLVRATDAGILDGHLFLVTDLVDGVDLNQLLERRGELSISDVCELGRAACEGLQYLAENKTVHRDIKPSNIMVDVDGQVRVLDLGLARNSDLSNSLTFEGQLMGTLDFMSPEQALNPRDVDFQADMYSMGCTLYYLLSGKAPFEDEQHATLAGKLMAHMELLATPVEQLRKDIPRPVSRLVMSMLEKDPTDRPASFRDVADVLSQYADQQNLSNLVVGSRTSESPTTAGSNAKISPSTQRRRAKPKRRSSIPAVFVGLLTLATLVYWMNQTKLPATTTALVSPASIPPCAIKNSWEDDSGIQDPRLPTTSDGLTEKGKKAWRFYLASPSHKAFVMDPISGNFGYATARATVEEAINAARAYAGPTARLYSVNGEIVEQTDEMQQPVAQETTSIEPEVPAVEQKAKPVVRGELQQNKFFSEG